MNLLKILVTSGFLLLHVFLLVWGIMGFMEWLLPSVPWRSVSNPDFTREVLFFHWSAIVLGGGTFLLGYFLKWPPTPKAMIFAYGFMAVMCALETFGFMTSETKYQAMAAEYLAYILIIVSLFYFPFFRERFS